MALITESGTGDSTSDSYVTVEYVDTYNASYESNSNWLNAQDNTKERACREATQWIDINFRFGGSRVNTTQALSFPRQDLTDSETDYVVDSGLIPLDLQKATALVAILYLNEDIWATDAQIGSGTTTGAPIKRQKDKVDVLETETEYAIDSNTARIQSSISKKQNSKIQNLLYRYTISGKKLRRG